MKNILILLFIGFLTAATAQDYKTDFKKSAAFYEKAEYLTMSVTAKTFETINDKKGTTLGSGKMYKSQKKYYSTFMDTEIIDNGNQVLMIDHENKNASYYPDNSITSVIPKVDRDIDSLLSSIDSVKFIGKKDGRIQYTCFGKKNDIILKYNITLSEKDYHILRIEYFYNQKSSDYEVGQYKIIVDYTSVSTSKITETEKFKIENHISKKGNDYVLNNKYSGYKLNVAEKKVQNKYIKG